MLSLFLHYIKEVVSVMLRPHRPEDCLDRLDKRRCTRTGLYTVKCKSSWKQCIKYCQPDMVSSCISFKSEKSSILATNKYKILFTRQSDYIWVKNKRLLENSSLMVNNGKLHTFSLMQFIPMKIYRFLKKFVSRWFWFYFRSKFCGLRTIFYLRILFGFW